MEQRVELEKSIRDHLKKTVIKATALPVVLNRYKVADNSLSSMPIHELRSLPNTPEVERVRLSDYKDDTLGFVGSVNLDD